MGEWVVAVASVQGGVHCGHTATPAAGAVGPSAWTHLTPGFQVQMCELRVLLHVCEKEEEEVSVSYAGDTSACGKNRSKGVSIQSVCCGRWKKGRAWDRGACIVQGGTREECRERNK